MEVYGLDFPLAFEKPCYIDVACFLDTINNTCFQFI
jgi:hypothetical protein